VDYWRLTRRNGNHLSQNLKSQRRDSHRINSFRNVIQSKLSVGIGPYRLTANEDLGSDDRTVLRIVNDALQIARGSPHGQTTHKY
jgi:hypothetical protein